MRHEEPYRATDGRRVYAQRAGHLPLGIAHPLGGIDGRATQEEYPQIGPFQRPHPLTL